MQGVRKWLGYLLGGLLFAAVFYVIAAAPGFLTGRNDIDQIRTTQDASR